jgi:hypothetical protein
VTTPLPTDLAEAHALILRQRAELEAAAARALGAEAMIAHLKLTIAKLKRERWSPSAERSRHLDQMELQLEELDAAAAEDAIAAEAARRPRPQLGASTGASRCGRRFRRICRASASWFRHRAPVPPAAASSRSSART